MRQNSKHKSIDENRLSEIDSLKSTKENRFFPPVIDYRTSIVRITKIDSPQPITDTRFSVIEYHISILYNRFPEIEFGNRVSDIDFQISIFGNRLSDIDRPNNKDRFSTTDYRYSIFGNRVSHIDSLQSIP